MTRLKATGLHFLLSLLLVVILTSAMLTLWYPNNYFELMGGKKLLLLIIGVDVLLGPLLTFIVFKSGKKTLKLDLIVIATFQLVAMVYGIYVMFEARPVFTVFNQSYFQVVSAVDIDPSELNFGRKDMWRTLSISGPMLVAVAKPDHKNKKETAFFYAVTEEAGRYPRLYDDYKNHQAEVIEAGKPLATLITISLDNKVAVDEFIKSVKRPISDFLFLPIVSMINEMSAVIDAKTGDLIKIIAAQPASQGV